MTEKTRESNSSQYQKFKDAARELETDESEANFDRLVKEIANNAERRPADKSKRDS